MLAIEWNFEAFKRVPWGGDTGEADFVEAGVDLSGADFRMEIREQLGASATAAIVLTKQAAGTQGISAQYVANYAHPTEGDLGPATIIRPYITEANMEGLALASPESADKVWYYDLHVTPVGGLKYVYAYGTFTVKPGATFT